MKTEELYKLSKDQLTKKLDEYKEMLVNFRFQKSLQQLEHPMKIKHIKKDIARIKTIINQHDLELINKK
ncbi:MAG: 50S ribosomal protein L29 [bacterium TMED198]|nr:MAG: 50S ribosomal protein L29 [bacterium TMED198]|tara:strand:+ start:586 stop:792 length:207 start_codon:yes stop_codon:yes gene_type:complete